MAGCLAIGRDVTGMSQAERRQRELLLVTGDAILLACVQVAPRIVVVAATGQRGRADQDECYLRGPPPGAFEHGAPSRESNGAIACSGCDSRQPRAGAGSLGLEEGSVKRQPDGVTVNFVVTDTAKVIPVVYTGILPDLFKEGKGVVAQGKLAENGVFRADEVLAKHDENYMPPEAASALEQADKARKTVLVQ